MSLSRGEINPLGVLNLRKLCFIPPHFSQVRTHYLSKMDLIENWIEYNLNSRYCIKKDLDVIDNKITTVLVIGIEDEKDLTMFTLGCKHLYDQV